MADDLGGYKRLACAVLLCVAEDYKSSYWRYITGRMTENVYQKHCEYLSNDFVSLLINAILHDTPEGFRKNIERKKREEMEREGLEKLRKHKNRT